ncbi:major facilitator superfamily domain-containing protein [Fusarium redolens]|uniref:Major facilitator superfamily domain-containing protein n=1 Tax=Fusarium redolens TaxID=48865 RepID=A0A9P9GQN3_FUSRE|nr:major facilitator superfamily domain-containing protein [Fusarium redolens]KAH7243730.1 major facilitator superfamily domain-containing protein [Fusarium redolens]
MAFGVLESNTSEQPSGTVFLEDSQDGMHTILVPSPSNSPNDPLNMSRIRKELYFLTLLFGACVTGALGPVLVPAFGIISQTFQTPLSNVALLNGSLILGLGVSSYFSSVISDLWGRRMIFILTSILLVVSNIWAAVSQGYESLLAARVFQGLAMGPCFSLAGTSCVNDVFFLHQRGRRVGLWNFAVIVSVNIAPVISGYLIVDMGWRWAFWFLAVAFAVGLIMVVFFLPETKWDRDEVISSVAGNEKTSDEKATPQDVETSVTPPTWKKIVGVHLQFASAKELLPSLVSPVLMLRHPVVIWGCIMWSITFTWVIVLGTVADQIFGAPPYSLDPTQVGLVIGIAPLVGSALGTLTSGWISDLAAHYMSAFNGGLYEPEFRLVVIVPSAITMAVGAFGLGDAIEHAKSTMACCIFLALINFGVGAGCTGIVTYTNDVCMDRAGNAFGLAMLIKSSFAFGLTFMLNDFYATKGPMVFFSTWGGLTLGICLTTVPLYVFGKRIRSWIGQH